MPGVKDTDPSVVENPIIILQLALHILGSASVDSSNGRPCSIVAFTEKKSVYK